MRDEDGFTLPELMIGMVIMSLLIVAIAGALIVSLKTTGATEQRLHESQDVLITSSYVANDVQSASDVNVSNAATNCSATFTTLVTFTYPSPGHPTAVYQCGTASNGETQVTRTFNNGPPIVVAHFAGTARPNVTVAYDSSTPPVPMSVTMRFTKPSDCTLDCTYTLFGSRRSFNPPSVTSGGSPLPGDVVLLSTGAASPLWVQGSCPDPGTTTGCIIDPTKTALPISDVQTTGWSPTPLWTPLSDADVVTSVASAPGSKAEARVRMGSVDPPDPGVTPTIEFHASSVQGAIKVAVSIYDGNTLLVQNPNIGNVNQPKNYDWTLSAAEAALIPPASYAHLTIGFSAPNAKGTDSLTVDGLALDTLDLSAAGLLSIKGPLYINSQLSTAVRLTGTKTATKISIINGGDFRIWSPGSCSGCNHNTVSCGACTWVGQQPWTSYGTSIPDPLRSLPAPPIPSAGNCTTGTPRVCRPGAYDAFAWSSDTQLTPGIYYLNHGISITGSASLTCPTCTGGQGVLLYIAGDAVTFAGGSRVNLPAATTGMYKGILMFQARSDTNALKFAGNSGSSVFCTMGGTQFGNCLNGIVYVPNSTQVTLATGSASLATKAVVAQNIKVSSSVTIG
jgi:prepilin-type N-terminal cleavage/methylation domain-containing protein